MNLTKELEIDENTLIIMSADNGGSLAWRELGGVNGDLRCGKVSARNQLPSWCRSRGS